MKKSHAAWSFVLACAACGGTSSAVTVVPPPNPEATEAPVVVSPPAPPAFPLPVAQVVRQTFGPRAQPHLTALDREADPLVVVGFGVVGFLDGEGRVTRRVTFPETLGFPTRLSPDGTLAAVRTGVVDLETGAFRANVEGAPMAGCDRALARCVTVAEAGDRVNVRVFRARTGDELAAFEIAQSALPSAPAGTPTSARTRETPHAALEGEHLALQYAITGGREALVIYDLGAHAVVAARILAYAASERAAFSWSGTSGARGLVIARGSVALIDTRASGLPELARVAGRVLEGATDEVVVTTNDGQHVQAHDRETLQPVGPPASASALIARGPLGSVIVDRTEVRFTDPSGNETARVSLEEPLVDARHPGDDAVLTRAGMYLRTTSGVLYRIRPDAPVEVLGNLDEMGAHYVRWSRDRVVVQAGVYELHLGPEGIIADHALRAHPGDDRRPLSERARALFGDAPIDVLAVAPPGTRVGAAFARLDARGTVHVIDAEGRPVGAPVRLPGAVARSRCGQLDFISDHELALSGPRPCVPTRIHFRERRTAPLGRAYVDVAQTADGSRVALMADRAIEVLDGRSGATLLRYDPELAHPRSIAISPDGSRVFLRGEGEAVLVDAHATPPTGEAPRTLRFGFLERSTYDIASDRIFDCQGDALRITRPFQDGEPQIVPVPSCGEGRSYAFGPGYVFVAPGGAPVVLVRLRDLATLVLDTVGTSVSSGSVLVVRGHEAIGVLPPTSTHFRLRGADGALHPLTDATSAVNEAVRAFFAPAP